MGIQIVFDNCTFTGNIDVNDHSEICKKPMPRISGSMMSIGDLLQSMEKGLSKARDTEKAADKEAPKATGVPIPPN